MTDTNTFFADDTSSSEFKNIVTSLNDLGIDTKDLSNSDISILVTNLLEQGITKTAAKLLSEIVTLRSDIAQQKLAFDSDVKAAKAALDHNLASSSFMINPNSNIATLLSSLECTSWMWNNPTPNVISNFKSGSYYSGNIPYTLRNLIGFFSVASKAQEKDERWFV